MPAIVVECDGAQGQSQGDNRTTFRAIFGTHRPPQGAGHIEHQKQAQTATLSPLGRLVGLADLGQQFGRVSNERLICGPGLVNLHRALSEIAGQDPGQPQPAQVSERAAAGDPVAMRAIEVFMDIFGAVAGDAVLVQGAWDGVFLTGGLVPRLLESLRHSGFRSHFENKGRFSATLSQVPSLAIVHPCPGLLGAAAYALDLEQAPSGAPA